MIENLIRMNASANRNVLAGKLLIRSPRLQAELGVPADSQLAVHMDYGVAEYMRKNDARALAEFNEVLRLDPRNAGALKNAAITLGNLGRNKEAVELFERYLEAAPGDGEARQAMEALEAAASTRQ